MLTTIEYYQYVTDSGVQPKGRDDGSNAAIRKLKIAGDPRRNIYRRFSTYFGTCELKVTF